MKYYSIVEWNHDQPIEWREYKTFEELQERLTHVPNNLKVFAFKGVTLDVKCHAMDKEMED